MKEELDKVLKAINEIEKDETLSVDAKLVVLNVLKGKVFELQSDIKTVENNKNFYENGFKKQSK